MEKKKKRNSVALIERATKNIYGNEVVGVKVAIEALNIEREEIMDNISKAFKEFLKSVF